MGNLFFGIAVLLICTLAYLAAWKYQRIGKFQAAILLLMLCGLILRLFISKDMFLHDWDERFHALVARNLMHHPFKPTLYDNPLLPYNYKNWAGNHIWLHKQPLPLWAMAASMRIFGVNEIALRLPSVLLSTTGIWLTYATGKYFFNRKTAFLAAFLYSLNGLILELTGGRVATDHIDIFFLFFIQLSIWFSIRFVQKRNTAYNILAGIALGAAILSKWLPALIVLPIWFLIVTGSGKFRARTVILQFLLVTGTCIAVFLPWQLYIFHRFPLEAAWESSFNFKHLTEVIEDRTGSFWYFFNRIRINYGELIYLPLGWFLWKTAADLDLSSQGLKLDNAYKRLALTTWFLIPFIFFTLVKTKMQAYLLFTSPALFMMTADFFYMLLGQRKNKAIRWVSVSLMVLLLALPVRYSIERLKPFQQAERNPQWTQELRELGREKIHNGVMFNYPNYIEAMFYTGIPVYEHMPEQDVIAGLNAGGYTIIINDQGDIPPWLEAMDGIITVNLDIKH